MQITRQNQEDRRNADNPPNSGGEMQYCGYDIVIGNFFGGRFYQSI